MGDVMTAIHLENLDRRLARVEQVLPTLATKEDLRRTVAEAVAPLATRQELAPLATKEELRAGISLLATKEDVRDAVAQLATKEEWRATKEELQAALGTLATRQELHALDDKLEARTLELRREIREEGEGSRRHMEVLIEAQSGDIQLLAEHLSIVVSKIADR